MLNILFTIISTVLSVLVFGAVWYWGENPFKNVLEKPFLVLIFLFCIFSTTYWLKKIKSSLDQKKTRQYSGSE